MGDEEARQTAMLWSERFSVGMCGNQRLATPDVFDGQIRSVTAVAGCYQVHRIISQAACKLNKLLHVHAFPWHAKFTPAGDAVDISQTLGPGQLVKGFPIQLDRCFYLSIYLERPVPRIYKWRRTISEHRPTGHDRLAGRNTLVAVMG